MRPPRPNSRKSARSRAALSVDVAKEEEQPIFAEEEPSVDVGSLVESCAATPVESKVCPPRDNRLGPKLYRENILFSS